MVHCGVCGAAFSSDEECDAHYYSTHYNPDEHSTIGCSHPNAWIEDGMLYCPDCGGYVSGNS